MCGIAGAMVRDGRDPEPTVATMTKALAHRGPDGDGVVSCRTSNAEPVRVALGHRRLAIIDLSPRGAQPMHDAAADLTITFNGEIYNFAELRRQLELLGHQFRSQSDTEVILKGYAQWGTGVLDRLKGMFALGIWDGGRQELLLARDRLGIKPLYLFADGTHVLFASEVRALLASGLVPRRADPVAVDRYLAYQTVPTPRTLIAGVRMLLPGHWCRVTGHGHVTEQPYWDLLDQSQPAPASVQFEDARREVHRLLLDSVAGHLISDVPIGIFLSGGIDSAALVALTRETGAEPVTFSVTMPGTKHDEAPLAQLVARRFGARHSEIALTADDLAHGIPEILASVDHPTGDGVNTFIVAQAVPGGWHQGGPVRDLAATNSSAATRSFRRLRRLREYAQLWR